MTRRLHREIGSDMPLSLSELEGRTKESICIVFVNEKSKGYFQHADPRAVGLIETDG